MFERFTDRARRVVVLAQEEARLRNDPDIRPDHLFLGLLNQGEGSIAHTVLTGLGYNLEHSRLLVDCYRDRPEKSTGGHIPFTEGAKKSLEFALREALQLGHNYIGTEHILLGLIRQDDPDVQVLLWDHTFAEVRQAVIRELTGQGTPEPTPYWGGGVRDDRGATHPMNLESEPEPETCQVDGCDEPVATPEERLLAAIRAFQEEKTAAGDYDAYEECGNPGCDICDDTKTAGSKFNPKFDPADPLANYGDGQTALIATKREEGRWDIYEESGGFDTLDPLAMFLYLVIRDGYMSPNEIEDLVAHVAIHENRKMVMQNGWLGAYAQNISARLVWP